MAVYGVIMSAGKQTRYNDTKPKSRALVGSVEALRRNIDTMSKVCDKVLVAVNPDAAEDYPGYDNLIPVISGLGSGMSVYSAVRELYNLGAKPSDTIIVKWGDALHFDEKLYEHVLREVKDEECVYIPVKTRHNPYVCFEADFLGRAKVLFSKYGDDIPEEGYQDLSMFVSTLDGMLFAFDHFLTSLEGKRCIRLRGEYEFCDTFNAGNCGRLVPSEEYDTYAYNTVEEAKEYRA